MKEKEIEPVEEVWSFKKIFIGVIVLTIIVGGLAYWNKDSLIALKSTGLITRDNVKGANTRDVQPRSISEINSEVQNRVNTLKEQVNSLNATEVATTSPQVQKILQDLKSLEQYPKNQAKEACIRVCNNF